MLDACYVEEVGGDNLIEHRSGNTCWNHWKQMVLHNGEYVINSFAKYLEVPAKYYLT